ncbi:MAG: acyltransferase family protein [Chloroflexota bacterium]
MPKTVPVSTDAAPTASGRPTVEADRRSIGRLRGLDGLRAVAVLAVVLYHAGLGGPSGGFLGVEVFFVISGFLITALLLAEHRATGRIDPIAFWLRRARRLLPALFFLLAATMAFAVVVVPEEIARLRADALAAVVYITNWHLIAGDQSYFESIGRPSLFVHLWSLAIEEQFYLFWPIVLALALLAGRRAALAMTLVGAAGSAAWMALQFDPASDPSRVYYGTDTRLTGLLLGAALAFVWVPPVPSLPTLRPGLNRRRRRRLLARAASAGLASGTGRWGSVWLGRALDLVAIAALAGLGGFFVAADAFEPLLYQGGLAILALLTVVVIAAAVHPRTHVGRVLDVAPLRWVGTRSYSIYLWHWPIFALTRPGLDIPLEAPATLVFRLVLTVMAAEASYRFVEMPIRGGSLSGAWAWVRATQSASSTRARRWSAAPVAGALAAVLSVLLVSVAMATPPPPPAGMETASIDGLVVDPEARPHDQPPSPRLEVDAVRSATAPTGVTATASAAAVTAAAGGAVPVATPTVAPHAATPTPSPSPTPRRSILAFGESVMIQGANAMARDLGPVRVDAAVGRHVGEGIKILERRATAGKLADTVIVQLGNNGPFRAGQFDAVMDALRDVRLVIWVNVRVPRDWEAHNNRVIESGVSNYPNARLVDWFSATAGRPELFWKDGYHPRPEGAELYADLIAAATR